MDKPKQTPESRLRAIAEASGMTMRELNELFQRVMIDDEKTRHRLIEQRKAEVEYLQLQLMQVQYRNEMMQNELLTGSLRRKVWREKLRTRIVGWFKRKPRHSGRIDPPMTPVGTPPIPDKR